MSAILIESYDVPGSGPSVAVKDCIDIAGARTCCGSRAFADVAPAQRNAHVVQALVEAGYRIIAKASMHELAYGMTGLNDWTGHVENPLYPGLMPGGSSSGSAAAVAAGLVDLSLGTDTGGSVRMPAACCGIIGFKPSFGRLSRDGLTPSDSDLDCVGLFARSMSLIEGAMAQMDPDFAVADPVARPAIGFVEVIADEEVAGAVAAALASLWMPSKPAPCRFWRTLSRLASSKWQQRLLPLTVIWWTQVCLALMSNNVCAQHPRLQRWNAWSGRKKSRPASLRRLMPCWSALTSWRCRHCQDFRRTSTQWVTRHRSCGCPLSCVLSTSVAILRSRCR